LTQLLKNDAFYVGLWTYQNILLAQRIDD
jgi:hypothetical protein